MRIVLGVLGLGAWMVAAGCATQAEGPPFKTAANVDQLMDAIITPAAEVYWGSVSTIITAEGIEENFPRTDEEWEAVWAAAMTLAESGNLLMMHPPGQNDDDWMRLSALLVDRGLEAVEAAENKDPDRILETGERVYAVCTQCHAQYLMDD